MGITTRHYLNTSLDSSSRLYSYFYSGSDKLFKAGDAYTNNMTQLAYSSYSSSYYTGYFKMNQTDQYGQGTMSSINANYYPTGGRIWMRRASGHGSYNSDRTVYLGYSTASSYALNTAHAGTVETYTGYTIHGLDDGYDYEAEISLSATFCEKVIAGRFCTIGCAIKPTSSTYPVPYSNYLAIDTSSSTCIILDIYWESRNTAPYWGGGAYINNTPNQTSNGGFVPAGTIFTASWGGAVDDQGNIDYYQYAYSSNNGTSWNYGTTSGTSFNWQVWTPGAVVKFAVRIHDSGGLWSSWIYSGIYTINYTPSAPTNLQIYDSTQGLRGISNGLSMKIDSSSYIVCSSSSDSGGYASGYGGLVYRFDGSAIGAWGGTGDTSREIGTSILDNYAGTSMYLSMRVSDGWISAVSSQYLINIGYALEFNGGPTHLSGDTILDTSTQIRVPQTYIDGSYGSVVNESISLQYRIDSGSWATLTSTIRQNNFSDFSNILKEICLDDSDFLVANHTVEFRGVSTINHLSATSSTLTLYYYAPTFTKYIAQADGSASFNYYISNPNIPITNVSIGAYYNVVRNSSADGTVWYLQKQYKIGTGGTWTNTGSVNTINAGSDESGTDMVTLSSIASRGQSIYFRFKLYTIIDAVTYTINTDTLYWNGLSYQEISYRVLPTCNITSLGGDRLNLISNDYVNNQILLNFNIENNNDVDIDYIISIAIDGGTEQFMYIDVSDTWDTETGLGNDDKLLTIEGSETEVTSLWNLESLIINAEYLKSINIDLDDNTLNIPIIIKVYVEEGLVGGRTGVPSGSYYTTDSITIYANTLCQPDFTGSTFTIAET